MCTFTSIQWAVLGHLEVLRVGCMARYSKCTEFSYLLFVIRFPWEALHDGERGGSNESVERPLRGEDQEVAEISKGASNDKCANRVEEF